MLAQCTLAFPVGAPNCHCFQRPSARFPNSCQQSAWSLLCDVMFSFAIVAESQRSVMFLAFRETARLFLSCSLKPGAFQVIRDVCRCVQPFETRHWTFAMFDWSCKLALHALARRASIKGWSARWSAHWCRSSSGWRPSKTGAIKR